MLKILQFKTPVFCSAREQQEENIVPLSEIATNNSTIKLNQNDDNRLILLRIVWIGSRNLGDGIVCGKDG